MALPSNQVKDPIVVELERVCGTLAQPLKFMHANLNEANFSVDQLPKSDFPVFVFVATTKNRTKINEAGHYIRTAKVVCMILDKIDGQTMDFSSDSVNGTINRTRLLADNLIYWLNRSPLSVNGGVEEFESDNVYQELDANLFGQGISFDWTVDTGTNGYYNSAP
jgi:hypothetical protein